MSFFGDIFAGKAEQRAAEYNASIIENNKKIKEQELIKQLNRYKVQLQQVMPVVVLNYRVQLQKLFMHKN